MKDTRDMMVKDYDTCTDEELRVCGQENARLPII